MIKERKKALKDWKEGVEMYKDFNGLMDTHPKSTFTNLVMELEKRRFWRGDGWKDEAR